MQPDPRIGSHSPIRGPGPCKSCRAIVAHAAGRPSDGWVQQARVSRQCPSSPSWWWHGADLGVCLDHLAGFVSCPIANASRRVQSRDGFPFHFSGRSGSAAAAACHRPSKIVVGPVVDAHALLIWRVSTGLLSDGSLARAMQLGHVMVLTVDFFSCLRLTDEKEQGAAPCFMWPHHH